MKVVRRKLADGTVKAYRYERSKHRPKAIDRSLGALIQEYRETPEFKRLKPNSQKVYLRAMGHMHPLYDSAIHEIRYRNVKELRDEHADTPALANQIRSVFATLMKYAVQMEYREHNPAREIEDLPTGEWARWPEAAVTFALAEFPERFRRAVLLALYTGQREGDCCKMLWSDYDGEGINVVQQKTGRKLWIACHSTLKANLNRWKRRTRSDTILADAHGKPWDVRIFAAMVSRETRRHGQLRGLVFHGLRKAACSRLLEAGCSAAEAASITGQSLQMVEHYSRQVDQKRLSRAAILKLENGNR